MPRQGSENKDEFERVLARVSFCPETGRRLACVRHDVTNLGEKSRRINTKAHGEVRALFEEEPENHCSHSSAAHSVLKHVKQRAAAASEAAELAPSDTVKTEVSENFSALEQRANSLPIRKVKNLSPVDEEAEHITPKLRKVIESVVDERLAQAN